MQKYDVKTFQGLILALQDYWAQQGCVIIQPLDMEVGAGTFHPQTFLKSIGPEPMSSAYVQPCRRPTDGRYGENPNRLQHYYQFQVVLKPSPDNIQELYLGSLEAMGIDTLTHEVRFVEDNWESPTLGAWGGIANTRRMGLRLGDLAKRYGSNAVYILSASRGLRVLSCNW